MWVKFALIYSEGGKHTIPFSLGANFYLIDVTLVSLCLWNLYFCRRKWLEKPL